MRCFARAPPPPPNPPPAEGYSSILRRTRARASRKEVRAHSAHCFLAPASDLAPPTRAGEPAYRAIAALRAAREPVSTCSRRTSKQGDLCGGQHKARKSQAHPHERTRANKPMHDFPESNSPVTRHRGSTERATAVAGGSG